MKTIKIILGIIIVISLIFFGTGLVIKEINYETKVLVNKPLKEVFVMFNDDDNLKNWIPELKSIDALEKKFPGLRSQIQTYYTSTPLSYRDYIGTQDGGMYGIVKDYKNHLNSFISTRTRIPNLLFTGQNLHHPLFFSVSCVGKHMSVDWNFPSAKSGAHVKGQVALGSSTMAPIHNRILTKIVKRFSAAEPLICPNVVSKMAITVKVNV